MSHNSLIAAAVLDMPLQDDAASTTVVNNAGTDGTLVGGDNTNTLSTTGPTTWLPKALQFDGTNDYVTATGEDADAWTVLCWFKTDDVAGFDTLVGDGSGGGGSFLMNIATQLFATSFPTSAQSPASSVATGTWYFAAATRSGTDVKVRLDDDEYTASGSAKAFNGAPNTYIGRRSDGNPLIGAMAGVAQFDSALSTADLSEAKAGPEPTYTSGATLASDGAYDVGTWDAQSNGTATYEWVVVEADSTVVDNGTGATGTADFGATTGLLTLLVRASNDGGYDVGDFATRASGYGSSGDGYYEVATVTIPLAPRAIYYQRLLRC